MLGQSDSLPGNENSNRWNMKPVSPLKASIYSAILPGAGQCYNGFHSNRNFFGKYWKIPVVYAGIGTCLAFIDFNRRQYRYYHKQYIAVVDNDPETQSEVNVTTESLNRVQDQYRRWLDVSYICLVGMYFFQIIEANVDAHLFYYDVSSDLSLQLSPALIPTAGRPLTGILLGFTTPSKKNRPCKLL